MAPDASEITDGPHHDRIAARLRDAEDQLRQARTQLLRAEQTNAEVGELREALRAAAGELDEQERCHAEEVADLRRALELSQAQTAHLEQLRADLQGSLSWKVTRPLRAAKRASGGASDPA